MKSFAYIAGALAVCIVAYAAIPPSSYSLNFHFIPPLVSAPCTFASVWNPANMTCAMCFCLNGRISRCVPQPGCSPLPNATTTQAPPGPLLPGQAQGGVPVVGPDGMQVPPVNGSAPTGAPVNPPPAGPGNPTNPPTNNASSTPAPTSRPPGIFRQAKLGKTFEKY